jgi:Zn-dependent peptidase ImmA (M78 family)
MRLHPSQRSKLAEDICRRWIKRRHLRLSAPKIYVIQRSRVTDWVWGRCYWSRGYITLHLGTTDKRGRRDKYILLAHEFAHYLHHKTFTRKNWGQPHGEQFQRILWGLVPRGLWRRSGSGQWVVGRSAHRPEYQP